MSGTPPLPASPAASPAALLAALLAAFLGQHRHRGGGRRLEEEVRVADGDVLVGQRGWLALGHQPVLSDRSVRAAGAAPLAARRSPGYRSPSAKRTSSSAAPARGDPRRRRGRRSGRVAGRTGPGAGQAGQRDRGRRDVARDEQPQAIGAAEHAPMPGREIESLEPEPRRLQRERLPVLATHGPGHRADGILRGGAEARRAAPRRRAPPRRR